MKIIPKCFCLFCCCLVAAFVYLAGDGEGAGGPFWDHVNNLLDKKHENIKQILVFDLFCLVVVCVNIARDREGRRGQFWNKFRNILYTYLFIYIY